MRFFKQFKNKKEGFQSLRLKISIAMFILILMPIFIFALLIVSISSDFSPVTNLIFSHTYVSIIIVSSILIIYCILILVFFDRYVFTPLEEIQQAVNNIKSGNLNYKINYQGNDEIGEFCNEFDKMRITLKNTIKEQHNFEKKRKRLIASITHDIRTPLTSIKGYVEALQDGIVKDKETYDLYLATINLKADELNHLVDDLSVYTKEELGEFDLNTERLNSGYLLNHYCDHKQILFKNSPISFIPKKPFIATYINIDPYRFNQVLDNLIGNAKKYAKDQIELYTSVSNYNLQIHIKDNGDGIPKDELHLLFDPFYMVNKKRDQKERGGSGLGLAICKQIVEKHGGRIIVESQHKDEAKNQASYTIFTITFPIDR